MKYTLIKREVDDIDQFDTLEELVNAVMKRHNNIKDADKLLDNTKPKDIDELKQKISRWEDLIEKNHGTIDHKIEILMDFPVKRVHPGEFNLSRDKTHN